jgi:hypothetical protein
MYVGQHAFANTALRSLVIPTLRTNASATCVTSTTATLGFHQSAQGGQVRSMHANSFPQDRPFRIFVLSGGVTVLGMPQSQTYVELYTSIFTNFGFDVVVSPLDLEPPEKFWTQEFRPVASSEVVNLEEILREAFTVEDNATLEEDMKFFILSVEFVVSDEELIEILPHIENTHYFIFPQAGSYRISFQVEDEFGHRSTPMQVQMIVG